MPAMRVNALAMRLVVLGMHLTAPSITCKRAENSPERALVVGVRDQNEAVPGVTVADAAWKAIANGEETRNSAFIASEVRINWRSRASEIGWCG